MCHLLLGTNNIKISSVKNVDSKVDQKVVDVRNMKNWSFNELYQRFCQSNTNIKGSVWSQFQLNKIIFSTFNVTTLTTTFITLSFLKSSA